jgi:hypothetical protein
MIDRLFNSQSSELEFNPDLIGFKAENKTTLNSAWDINEG